jgi:hypothetical protein
MRWLVASTNKAFFPLKITYVQAYAQDGLHTKIDVVINSYFWYEPSCFTC